MKRELSAWFAAASAWLWALSVEAQTSSVGSGGVPAFEHSMNKGLVPLFFYVSGAIVLMGIAALVAVLFLRPRLPTSLRGT